MEDCEPSRSVSYGMVSLTAVTGRQTTSVIWTCVSFNTSSLPDYLPKQPSNDCWYDSQGQSLPRLTWLTINMKITMWTSELGRWLCVCILLLTNANIFLEEYCNLIWWELKLTCKSECWKGYWLIWVFLLSETACAKLLIWQFCTL